MVFDLVRPKSNSLLSPRKKFFRGVVHRVAARERNAAPASTVKAQAFSAAPAESEPDRQAEAQKKLERLGVTGDLFGGINALFAALAFGGVAIAAYLQYGTGRQARVQSFEISFFSSVDLLHRIVEGLTFRDGVLDSETFSALLARARKLAGIEAPKPELQEFHGREVFPAIEQGIARRSKTAAEAQEKYRLLQTKHNYVLGHYFRHLYQVLKLIDRQPVELIGKSDKEAYASILRAQLSASELALVLMNCTGDMVDKGAFRNLLVKYRMLEHLPYRRDGNIYRSRQSDLILGDLPTMQQFKHETPQESRNVPRHGAFGSNPEIVPD